ncbi:HD-GYP domain-containing protein [Neorhodopirellula pilleata]|uniref:Cyclic di-GMP phosphodiesterase response regulator RpfG n=1 Tax=Neorhodopirellula pilleata TaxID=2714738 RepID=A0A5C6A2X1_9BACT|nr:response regulator [Neorhodopirellula pilleata]TWT94264.1 Cyclic di-GMP phosphodiesterase response regulator RpfG [Neorhodopirellula pilleata]
MIPEIKVLIVDDDNITRMMLRHLLTGAGYRIDEASDGVEALQMIAERRYQVVISDWNMPEMTGVELCRRIRHYDQSGYIYTILLTSNNQDEDRIEGMRAGADDFVGKPFNERELLQRVAAGQRVLQLETKEALIFALAKLAESRDFETGNHLERVRRYARLLASEYLAHPDTSEVDEEFAELVFQTSPLHDIGKVGIPDSILLHPGKLTAEQFDIMKTHTTIGADCLAGAIERSPQAKFLQMAYKIALCHHEKYDGSGYPNGLSGEEIPIEARIVAIADVYDALRTKRVYKPAFSHEKTLEIIVQDSGTHFDPHLVALFQNVHRQFEAIADRFEIKVDVDDQQ